MMSIRRVADPVWTLCTHSAFLLQVFQRYAPPLSGTSQLTERRLCDHSSDQSQPVEAREHDSGSGSVTLAAEAEQHCIYSLLACPLSKDPLR